jgi:hypothetical protein
MIRTTIEIGDTSASGAAARILMSLCLTFSRSNRLAAAPARKD